ncbi:MAG: restriction endonuclease subunit S [Bacteroidaceae bacterium]|nr:restriction endonuclease subunit S [Bacteroidaceae bacterium]
MPYSVPQNIDPDKIFLVNFSELEGRWDPQFYTPKNLGLVRSITKRVKWKRLKELVRFSTETWNQKDFFEEEFPYVEISEIDTSNGDIRNINFIEIAKAPSRAKMIVHNGDIIISTTRPTRGAINLVNTKLPILIASTGFSVIREVDENVILKTALFIILRLEMSLLQMGQRSSGGNYPAITQDELGKIIIPIPPLHIQQQIVDVYNAALSLRKKKLSESKAKLASIDQYLLDELGITLPKDSHEKTFIVNYKDVDGGRLDPNFYRLEYSSLVSNLRESDFCKVKDVVVFSDEMWNQESLFSDYFPYLEISGINLEYGQIEAITLTRKKDAPSRAKMILRKGDLIVSLTRPMRGAIAIFDIADYDVVIASTGFSVIRDVDSKRISKDYLCVVLKSSIVLKQFAQRCSGGNYPAITQYDLGCVSIPLPSLDKQQEIADHISAIRAEAKRLEQEGEEILQSARLQVEQIILGEKDIEG